MQTKFTVFTPVFNGAAYFHRVFNSLKNQTYQNFEWIIINDGSTDNSEEIITKLIDTVDWDITYLKQKNCGKHVSWNRAIKIAKGDLFVPADCDDEFIPETLNFFSQKWDLLDNRESFSGINVLCFDGKSGSRLGTMYPCDGYVSDNLSLTFRLKPQITGEKWGCIRVDLLKEIPFPEVEANYFTESYLWFSLARKYKVICYNHALRGYHREPTSLTNNEEIKRDLKKIKMFRIYNVWLVRNFGIYLLANSPVSLFNSLFYIVKSILYNMLSRFN